MEEETVGPRDPSGESSDAPVMERGRWIWYAAGAVLAAVMLMSVLTIVLADQMRAVDSRVVVVVFAGSAVAVWVAVTFGFRCGPAASLQVLTMLIIVTVALLSVIYTDTVERFAGQSYLAVLILSFVGAATVILPAPAALGVVSIGVALDDPYVVGLVAATGQTAGELIAYLVGATSKQLVERGPGYARIRAVLGNRNKLAGLAIFALAAVPNPAFDVVGLIAGAVRYSLWRFFALAWLGNAFKYVLVWGSLGAVIFRALGSA